MDRSHVGITGPLTDYVDGFWSKLVSKGYASGSAINLTRVLAHLSRWMSSRRLEPGALEEEHLDAFVRHRRRAGYRYWRSRKGLAPLESYLRQVGAMPAALAEVRLLPPLLAAYQEYLETECVVRRSTANQRLGVGQRFLDHIDGLGIDKIDHITGKEVLSFLLRESHTTRSGSLQVTASQLRCFLRFLHVRGAISTDLAAAVPSQARRRQAGLPKVLRAIEVQQLLQSCDRRTHKGRRNYAAIVLMLRMGLRVGEVAMLELEDINWRDGSLVVHGKGGQIDRLPLPDDVGQALARYLQYRPRLETRRVFLRVHAPQGPLSVAGLRGLVRETGKRAGIGGIGTHRLRHTAASRMLQCGASLSEVSHVLRHRHLDTTAIYAKIDRDSLRDLAQPWPGGKR